MAQLPGDPRYLQYTATASQTVFSYDFIVYADDELIVQSDETTLTLTTEYTVQDAGESAGGTITLVTGATVGDVITITGNSMVERDTTFVAGGDYLASAINGEYDKLDNISSELVTANAEAFKLAKADSAISKVVPTPSAGLGIKWNAGATALIATTYDPDDAQTDSAASAAAALVSENAAALSETAAGTSETNAGLSETAAGLSETAAGLSETAAGTSETNAGNSETNAGSSASAASGSADQASAAQTVCTAKEVLTNQDALDTAADVVTTTQDAIDTAADVVTTTQDAIDTAADAVTTAQDAIDTAADVGFTNADVVSTNADVVTTTQDALDTAADVVTTTQDAIDTAADAVTTAQDAIDTAADVVTTTQDAIDTAADVVTTTQDAIDTAADVVLTNADVVTAAASAASINAAAFEKDLIPDNDSSRDLGSTAKRWAECWTDDINGRLVREKALYTYVVSQGTSGGTATTGSYQERPINTEVFDTIGCTLSSNQITVPAGTYLVDASVANFNVNAVEWDIFDNEGGGTIVANGMGVYSGGSGNWITSITTAFTVAASSAMSIRCNVEKTQATNGMGVSTNEANHTEVFLGLKLTRVI